MDDEMWYSNFAMTIEMSTRYDGDSCQISNDYN